MYFCERSAFLTVIFAFKKHADLALLTESLKMSVGSHTNECLDFQMNYLFANALLAFHVDILLNWLYYTVAIETVLY